MLTSDDDDEKTIVPPAEAAIITEDGMTSLSLKIPNYIAENDDPEQEIPELLVYLAACIARADDRDFVNEQLAWMAAQCTEAVH